jgi:hypothetical protein
MSVSISSAVEELFLKEKSHSLSVKQLYEAIKDDFPDKDSSKLKHSIRRSVQRLCIRGFIERTGNAIYTIKDN